MESHYSEGNLSDQYDGLIFINFTTALKVVKLEPKVVKSNLANKNGKRCLLYSPHFSFFLSVLHLMIFF